ncbi:MAG: LysR family transcriptional regulator [Berryella intestinalis]|uniref:LysR family transcriptional regulator n=1 Tax=Berryella intestinalis TaxID=1531429 RepID=UPI002A573FB4|nr:LysR family transcriptional regulator [Berryella intestinalis]MDD7369821.1 LysR family transcriptional regulator [Berryella intestinalis]MDY3129133.1 LysR family transcriptional regulator [Berryella intestinalis]
MLNIEIRQLEYFTAAARMGSYAQAAKHLFVSPQAISKSVQVLESHLGVNLFERNSNGIALTDFGKLFYEKSCAVIGELEELQREAERHVADRVSIVPVGIHSLCFKENGGSIARSDLLSFSSRYPDVDFRFMEMSGDAIVESIAADNLDFAITVPPDNLNRDYESIELRSFPIAAIVPREEGAPLPESLTVPQLSGRSLVSLSGERELNKVFIDQAEAQGDLVAVSSLQIAPNSDIGFITECKVYSIRPLQHALRTVSCSRVGVVPVVDDRGAAISIPLYLFWKKGRRLAPMERSLLERITSLYRR